ncbi:MAG TPA: amino acid adenylation domain-containing protein [Kofleriaceae bacterium]|nr:amino acid adenylation domain-containing protein [Kofleriaceae bacterium]
MGGIQVARGYLNQPGLTAERFIVDPFAHDADARLYRTGDLGRWRPDGAIEYLGRNDHQVKIRGVRIELGEIEARLADVTGVAEVIVLAREDEPGNPRLVAYYTVHADALAQGAASIAAPEPEVMRAHATQSLPPTMVPAAYVRMDAMPVTSNGKLDRKALPAPDAAAFAQRTYEPPQGATEETLAAIWAELLGVERIGRHDSFFALGGHSLIAVRLIERMRLAGLHADVRTVFNAATLAVLARQVGATSDEVCVPVNLIPASAARITPDMLTLVDLSQASIDAIVADVDGGAAAVQDIYPLAPLQEGILFHHLVRKPDDADPYVMSGVLAFASRARLDRFLGALQQVIDRHDILRTSIAWRGLEQPVQVVHRRATLPVDVVAFDPAAGDIAAQLAADARDDRIDVTRAPLLRCRVAVDPPHDRHLLRLTFHHLALDHTTLETVLEEARALEDGRTDLPAPAPFRDFVAQARLRVSVDEHEAFFRNLVGDIDAPTAPFGELDVQGDGRGIAEVGRALPPELARAVRDRARALGVSAASLIHLAWALVLARTTGRRDVVFGTVLLGRMHGGARANRALGVFINTLPLRVAIDGRGIADVARATHATLIELLRHEHAPLALAQRCSAVPAQAPLFTSLVNYRFAGQRTDEHSLAHVLGDGIELVSSHERTSYPLGLTVDDLGEQLAITLKATASIGAARLCDFVETALSTLVDALADSPARAASSLDVLPAAERAQLAAWNQTSADLPGACLAQRFEAQVARTPDAAAVIDGDTQMTFTALDMRANRLAHTLRGLGVGPDRLVAICLPRSAEMIVAIVAILKAGGAYVPLDPSSPADRLAQVIADAAPVCVLSQSQLASVLPADAPVVMLDRDAAAIAAWPATCVDRAVIEERDPQARRLAYVIYTSGSTGRPKGVMVEHRSVVNLWAALERAIHAQHPGRADRPMRVSLNAPLAFDSSVKQWVQLLSGRTLVVIPDDVRADGAAMLQLITEKQIDVLDCTPSQLAVIQDAARVSAELLPCAIALVGGEAIGPAQWRALAGCETTAFYNVYGPTECTVDATVARIGGAAVAEGSPTIGAPLANVQVYIVDEAMRRAPIGVVGEIVIGGTGVARGYLHDPARTAERFVDDPFAPAGAREGRARMYRTGDLGRWRPDGTIEYVGRNDFQIKIRGYRIELGEIEARLAEVPGVDEAVIVAHGASGEQRLVAYFTGASGGDAAIDAAIGSMRAQVAKTLPAYMAPSAYVHLAAMPLNANGKLDRKALPDPEAATSGSGARSSYVAPRGELEELIAGLWTDLLRRDRIGRHDHFFELGGHSLLAVQLVARLRRVLGVELSLSDLFAHPELDRMAAHIGGAARSALPAIPAGTRQGPQPVSLAQQRLWFLSTLEGASSAYHIRGAVRLDGALDRGALVRALERIVERHEALRTTFEVIDGEPMQVVHPHAELALEEHDVRAAGDVEAAARALRDAHGARPFDLARDVPMRVQLVRVADEAHVLQIVMHHIASDGWSIGILLDELSQLYAAFSAGKGDPLPPMALRYADHAAWQRDIWASGQLAGQSEYWRTTLVGAPMQLTLPWDRPRPAQQDHTGATVPVELDAALVKALRALSRQHGVTMYMTLLASWAAVLSRLANQKDVVIGSPVAGRQRAELEPVVGCFVNTLAHRIDVDGDPTVAELLARTRAQVLAAQDHQDLPFDQVVEAVKPARSLAHTPLFQVMLDWDQAHERSLALPGLAVTQLPRELRTAQFDLTLSLRECSDGDGIHGLVSYATALFDPATVERYRGYWIRFLHGMVAEGNHAAIGERSIATIPLLDDAERQQVVAGWNATETAYPTGLCLHELFEAQVARTPDAIAVVDGERRLTYAELNARANQLARELVRRGVGPDVPVGLCLERSAEMVIAVYAAIKAGGCYMPLDPDYPADRLRRMVSNSAPKVVLCDAVGEKVIAAVDGGADRSVDAPCRAGIPRIRLSADAWPWAREPAGNLAIEGTNRRLAYVIYTSGSTGTPKGVMNEHRGAVNRMQWMQEAYGLGGNDIVLQKTPFSFDVSVWEFFWPLMTGAQLVMARPHGHKDPGYLAELIQQAGVTTLHFVPSMLQAFLAHEGSARCTGLARVICSGEALPAPLVRGFHERLPGVELHNLYGPTEAAVDVTAWACVAGETTDSIPIGRPIANTQIYILDERMQPVGVGVAGEVHIGGIQVARGYLNQPDLTAERFITDPFAHDADARLYRTGDLGRWRPDGAIEYLGRNDHQVKIRGVRIELGEIEARLVDVAGVAEVIVLAREDEPGSPRLVAYYTVHTDEPAADEAAAAMPISIDATPKALRTHASRCLPPAMVPAAYVRMPAMPVTSNGKLDRKALPAPDGAALAQRAYEAPEGEIEEALARIWAELLRIERVGRRDSFFALGGHSLLAVRLLERMRRENLHTDVVAIFTAATLTELAAQIRTAGDEVIVPPNLIDRDRDLSDADEPAWASDVEELRL